MDHYTDSHPRARKPHICDTCGRTIQAREIYRRGAGMDGATAWTWKECAHCELLIAWLGRINYLEEEYCPEVIEEWEPETLSDLRLKACWAKRWTFQSGALMPPPEARFGETSNGYPFLASLSMAVAS